MVTLQIHVYYPLRENHTVSKRILAYIKASGKFREIEEITFSDLTRLGKIPPDFRDNFFGKDEPFWKTDVIETKGIANSLLKEVTGRTAEINLGKKIWNATKGLHDDPKVPVGTSVKKVTQVTSASPKGFLFVKLPSGLSKRVRVAPKASRIYQLSTVAGSFGIYTIFSR